MVRIAARIESVIGQRRYFEESDMQSGYRGGEAREGERERKPGLTPGFSPVLPLSVSHPLLLRPGQFAEALLGLLDALDVSVMGDYVAVQLERLRAFVQVAVVEH